MRRIKALVLVETTQHIRIFGKFEDLPCDHRTGSTQDRARVVPEIIQPTAHRTSPYSPKEFNGGCNLSRGMVRYQRAIRKQISFHIKSVGW